MTSAADSNAIPLNGFVGSSYGAADGSGRKEAEAEAADGSAEDRSDLFQNEEVKVDLLDVDDVRREKEKLLQVRIYPRRLRSSRLIRLSLDRDESPSLFFLTLFFLTQGPSVCLSSRPSACLSKNHLRFCLAVCPSVHPPVKPSVCFSVSLSVCLSEKTPELLSVRLSVRLFVSLSVRPHLRQSTSKLPTSCIRPGFRY